MYIICYGLVIPQLNFTQFDVEPMWWSYYKDYVLLYDGSDLADARFVDVWTGNGIE